VEIDPYDANKAWFVTGYGVYETSNLKNADSNTALSWVFENDGLEELVATSLVSPASGVPLLSAVGDQDGFRHVDLNISPVAGKHNPSYGSNNSIDVAESNSNYVVRTYNNSGGNYGSYSTDQGITWTKFASYPSGTSGGGSIAVSANAARIVWTADGASAVYYSSNNGATWTAATGISSGLASTGDKVNGNKFYSYNASTGVFLVSTNGGSSFSNGAAGLPTLQSWELWMAQARAVFGIEGDVWFTSGHNGLYHSINSGTSFTKISGVDAAYKIAFGKAASGETYPAIYIQGRVSGVYGFYRSTDAGATWVRINDSQHNFLGIRSFAADPKTFGRIYLGTSGRGLIYGDDVTVLPVRFSLLNVMERKENKNAYADVQWATATEINSAYFVVERSMDAANWKDISRISSNQAHTYKYSDNITALSGIIYYRIRQVDNDGKINYSSVVSLKHAAVAKTTVTAWPNPAEGGIIKVHVNSAAEQKITVRLVDINGRILYTSAVTNVISGENIIEVPVSNFAKGNIYFAEVLNAGDKTKIGAVKVVY
jgi:hypothetical protein